ncbi:hypothetical protein PHMEG_00030589 [Phytophthora megakarya]|uniref:Uncharacterized protein n=1 Tax=Phytophthora megakarya TaxID=4795 RepID=A0A225V1M3_9STRA|nr:hypothetical protein PHMEG_00030589 [Phytophthora megakarya]
MDMENAMPDLALPARCHVMSRPRSVNGDVRVSRSLDPASDVPQHLHDQHNVELNALRCLSLKMMLSNLSTPNSSTSANASKSNYAYPGVNEGAKTPLLPIRQPSLQSV